MVKKSEYSVALVVTLHPRRRR